MFYMPGARSILKVFYSIVYHITFEEEKQNNYLSMVLCT